MMSTLKGEARLAYASQPRQRRRATVQGSRRREVEAQPDLQECRGGAGRLNKVRLGKVGSVIPAEVVVDPVGLGKPHGGCAGGLLGLLELGQATFDACNARFERGHHLRVKREWVLV